MSKKWLYLLVIAVLVLPMILTACGATEEPAPTEVPAVEEPTAAPEEPEEATAAPEEPAEAEGYENVDPTGATVLWWHNHTTIRDEALQEMVAEFNASNEWGIEVTAEYAGAYDEIYNKMLAAIAADDPTLLPQLTVGYANTFGKYMLADALVDMDLFVDSPTWGLTAEEKADFFPGIFESDVSPLFGDGHYRMGFPPNRSMEVLYYNQEWLAELGYDGPPTTWDEFKEMACAATDPDAGTVGLTVGEGASFMAGLTFSRHGTYYLEDGSAFDFTNEAVTDSMRFMKELLDEGCFARPAERYGEQADFGNYKTLFTVGSSSGLPYYDQAVIGGEQGEFLWSVAPLPYAGTGDEPVQNIYGGSVAVPKTTPEQELAAWLFVKWLTSPDMLARWAKVSGYFPVRQSVAAEMADYFDANPAYKTAFELLPYGTFEAQWCPCYEEVRNYMADAFSAILDGADIDSTLTQLEADANVSLEENMPGVAVLETPVPTEEPEEEAPPEAEGGGGTFVFGRGGDSVQLDPAIVTDGESFRVTGQCLEPLYQYEPGSTTPIPALATECTPNEAGTEWTCTLREGVKFHDGTDFNADAVIFNFDRWRFTDNPYHFESQVFEYYEYMWFGFDDDSVITDIEKIDDYTVKFVLAESLAPFLANLAMDMFAISSPAAIEEYGEDYGLPAVGCVGTGPFKYVEWVEGDHITVEAYDDYWGGRPSIDQVVWRVIPDDSARFLALRAGDIHALETATAEDIAAADEDPELYVNARPALNTGYLAFNYAIEEMQDINFRKAVVHAINRQGLVEAFLGKYGEVATNFLPPLIMGHNDAIEDWAYDPDMAQQYLADAGFPDGISEVTLAQDIADADGNIVYAAGDKIPLRLYYLPVTRFYYPSPKEIGEAMAADLARAGINVTLELAGDWSTYLGLRRTGQLVGLYMLGWGGDNGDPDNFHNYFWGGLSSADEVKEPDQREGWYANQEVATLCYEAAINPDPAQREELYNQIEVLLHDDVARLWVDHYNTPLLFSTKVSGYVPQPVGADYYEGVVLEE
ncbi:MAG: extracellular solute-binding protein [Anaerolineae bacterium]|jgi:ABC-type transport system substrate-binding protein